MQIKVFQQCEIDGQLLAVKSKEGALHSVPDKLAEVPYFKKLVNAGLIKILSAPVKSEEQENQEEQVVEEKSAGEDLKSEVPEKKKRASKKSAGE